MKKAKEYSIKNKSLQLIILRRATLVSMKGKTTIEIPIRRKKIEIVIDRRLHEKNTRYREENIKVKENNTKNSIFLRWNTKFNNKINTILEDAFREGQVEDCTNKSKRVKLTKSKNNSKERTYKNNTSKSDNIADNGIPEEKIAEQSNGRLRRELTNLIGKEE